MAFWISLSLFLTYRIVAAGLAYYVGKINPDIRKLRRQELFSRISYTCSKRPWDVCVLAPALEELVFRAPLIVAVAWIPQVGSWIWVGIVLQAVLFMLMPLHRANPYAMWCYFAPGGIAFGAIGVYCTEAYGGFVAYGVVTGLHIANNSLTALYERAERKKILRPIFKTR